MADEPDMKCAEALDNLVAYVQGELDGPAVRAMEAHLAGCEVCRREEADVRATFQMVRETHHEFVPSDRVWKALLERLHSLRDRLVAGQAAGGAEYGLSEAPAPPVEGRSGAEPAVPRKRRMTAALVSVAAVAVLVAAVVIVLKLTAFSLVLKEGEQVTVLAAGGDWHAVKPGQRIEKGWNVKTAQSSATLEYGDGSTLEVNLGTEFKVVADREIALENGALTADIKPSSKGFTVSTDCGVVRTESTRFSVEVSKEPLATRVRVFEGAVTFETKEGQVVVKAGQVSLAAVNTVPQTSQAETAAGGQSAISPDTVRVRISISSDGVNFDAGDAVGHVWVDANKPLFVRFEVDNISKDEMTLPTGRTGGLNMLLWLPQARDITTLGEMTADDPATTQDNKTVKIAPGATYRFYYRIEKTKFEKGRKYEIRGMYCLVGSQGITVEVK